MNNLILAIFEDEFFLKAAQIVNSEIQKEQGILFLRKTMTEFGYEDSFINATIKKLHKTKLI
jgi:hypothetical protein